MDDTNENLKEDWLIVVSYKTELLSEYLIHKGYRESTPRLLPEIPNFRNRMNIDNDIYIDLNETKKIEEYFSTDTINRASKVYEAINKQSEKLIHNSRGVVKDIENLSNEDLSKRLVDFFNDYQDTLGMIGMPTVIDMTIESQLRQILDGHKLETVDEWLSSLAIPYKSLESSKERMELLKLAEKINKNDYDLDSDKSNLLIREHSNIYGWLHTTLFMGDRYDESQIREEIKEVQGSATDLIKAKEQEDTRLKTEAENAISKINSTDGQELANFFQKAVYYRTVRLEWMNKACFIAWPLLEETASRLGIEFSDLIYLMPDEITNSLNSSQVDSELKKKSEERQNGYAMVSDNNCQYLLFIGKDLGELKKEHAFDDKQDKDEIRGMVAYKGKVRGDVVVVNERSELNKVKKGNILVTRLTTPDFVMAMKIAAATVTDLGGITSHAAVTSRELMIPCIVGTKIATKILKDGDEVEVDADRGIVKIIK